MNKIEWTSVALRQLKRLPVDRRRQIHEAVGALAAMPDCGNVKRLKNHRPEYRLRVGRYRVLFEYYQTVRVVEVQEVVKRDEHTYA